MDNDHTQSFRKRRLSELLEIKFEGNKAKLGRAAGHKTGAFIRQLLDGERPISEKTVLALEAIPGVAGWFSEDAPGGSRPSSGGELTTGAFCLSLAAAVMHLPELRREKVASLVSALIKEGPDSGVAAAIDALIPSVLIASREDVQWRHAAFSLAESNPDPETKRVLTAFVRQIALFVAEENDKRVTNDRETRPQTKKVVAG